MIDRRQLEAIEIDRLQKGGPVLERDDIVAQIQDFSGDEKIEAYRILEHVNQHFENKRNWDPSDPFYYKQYAERERRRKAGTFKPEDVKDLHQAQTQTQQTNLNKAQ